MIRVLTWLVFYIVAASAATMAQDNPEQRQVQQVPASGAPSSLTCAQVQGCIPKPSRTATPTSTKTPTPTPTPSSATPTITSTPTIHMTPENAVVFVQNGGPNGADSGWTYDPTTNHTTLNPLNESVGGELTIGTFASGNFVDLFNDPTDVELDMYTNSANNITDHRMFNDSSTFGIQDFYRRGGGTNAVPSPIASGNGVRRGVWCAIDADGVEQCGATDFVYAAAAPSPSYVPMTRDFGIGGSDGTIAVVLRLLGLTYEVALPQITPSCYQLGLNASQAIVCKATTTPILTATPTATATPTITATPTSTATSTATATPTPTVTSTADVSTPTRTATPTATQTGATPTAATPTITPTPNVAVPIAYAAVVFPLGTTTQYFWGSSISTSVNDVETPIVTGSRDMAIANLWCVVDNAVGVTTVPHGTILKIDVFDNGVATGLSCMIHNNGSTCSDLAASYIFNDNNTTTHRFAYQATVTAGSMPTMDLVCGMDVLSGLNSTPTVTATPTATVTSTSLIATPSSTATPTPTVTITSTPAATFTSLLATATPTPTATATPNTLVSRYCHPVTLDASLGTQYFLFSDAPSTTVGDVATLAIATSSDFLQIGPANTDISSLVARIKVTDLAISLSTAPGNGRGWDFNMVSGANASSALGCSLYNSTTARTCLGPTYFGALTQFAIRAIPVNNPATTIVRCGWVERYAPVLP